MSDTLWAALIVGGYVAANIALWVIGLTAKPRAAALWEIDRLKATRDRDRRSARR